MKNILLKTIFFLMLCNSAFSADENIDMLNRLGKEINVYSKKLLMWMLVILFFGNQ